MTQCGDFVKFTFVEQSSGVLDGEPWFNKNVKGSEIKKFITHKSWRCIICASRGHVDMSGQSRESTRGPGHNPLLRSAGGVLWGSTAVILWSGSSKLSTPRNFTPSCVQNTCLH